MLICLKAICVWPFTLKYSNRLVIIGAHCLLSQVKASAHESHHYAKAICVQGPYYHSYHTLA